MSLPASTFGATGLGVGDGVGVAVGVAVAVGATVGVGDAVGVNVGVGGVVGVGAGDAVGLGVTVGDGVGVAVGVGDGVGVAVGGVVGVGVSSGDDVDIGVGEDTPAVGTDTSPFVTSGSPVNSCISSWLIDSGSVGAVSEVAVLFCSSVSTWSPRSFSSSQVPRKHATSATPLTGSYSTLIQVPRGDAVPAGVTT